MDRKIATTVVVVGFIRIDLVFVAIRRIHLQSDGYSVNLVFCYLIN